MALLRRSPGYLHGLTGDQFEYVVAELLERQGYTVSVSPKGPDDGVDIFAARNPRLGNFLYLVQCKRFRPGKLVGPDVVDRLYGKVSRENATAGLVVTTSGFTRRARGCSSSRVSDVTAGLR